jgi:hypothetical protein
MKAPMAFIAEHIVPALRHGCPQGGAIAARRRVACRAAASTRLTKCLLNTF